jgi:hypothetical protein
MQCKRKQHDLNPLVQKKSRGAVDLWSGFPARQSLASGNLNASAPHCLIATWTTSGAPPVIPLQRLVPAWPPHGCHRRGDAWAPGASWYSLSTLVRINMILIRIDIRDGWWRRAQLSTSDNSKLRHASYATLVEKPPFSTGSKGPLVLKVPPCGYGWARGAGDLWYRY